MRFSQFDPPHDLGNLFEQAATGARAAAKQEAYRQACAAVVAAYHRDVAVGRPISTALMAACEQAKRTLP